MKASTVEDQLLQQYGGRGKNLPQTLVFDHVSPATRLLEKRRQMYEVQEALNAQKEEFARREDTFRRREDALRRKDLELQEQLIKFNKFLQENETKRNRAMKKTTEEKKLREQKEHEIKVLLNTLHEKEEEEKQLKQNLQQNLKYQDFLENVVQSHTKFFPEIIDVLNRHQALVVSNKQLLEKQISEQNEQETLSREYQSYRKSKENQILNENNEIAELQIHLERCLNVSMQLQNDIDQNTSESSEKALLLGQIISSVANILERCEENFRRRHNKPPIDRSHEKNDASLREQTARTLSKLDDIAMFMIDFRDIKIESAALAASSSDLSNGERSEGTEGATSSTGAGAGNGGLTSIASTLIPNAHLAKITNQTKKGGTIVSDL